MDYTIEKLNIYQDVSEKQRIIIETIDDYNNWHDLNEDFFETLKNRILNER